jgi:hypothetical protein
VLVAALACYCIISKINMDKILNFCGTLTSTLVAYIFPFSFFLNTFQRSHTKAGKRFIRFIKALYYIFWLFQVASIASLFIDTSG